MSVWIGWELEGAGRLTQGKPDSLPGTLDGAARGLIVDVSRPGPVGRPEESGRAHILLGSQNEDREHGGKDETMHCGWVRDYV